MSKALINDLIKEGDNMTHCEVETLERINKAVKIAMDKASNKHVDEAIELLNRVYSEYKNEQAEEENKERNQQIGYSFLVDPISHYINAQNTRASLIVQNVILR